jgi:hypothetical protein
MAGLGRIRLLQIREQNLRVQPAVGEDDRLQLAGESFFCDSCGFVDVAASNPQISIHHRRVVEDEDLLSNRRSVLFDNFNFRLDQLRSQFARIRNRPRLKSTSDRVLRGGVWGEARSRLDRLLGKPKRGAQIGRR